MNPLKLRSPVMRVLCGECDWCSISTDNMAELEFRYNHGPTRGHHIARVLDRDEPVRFIYAAQPTEADIAERVRHAVSEYHPTHPEHLHMLFFGIVMFVMLVLIGSFFLIGN